METVQSTEEPLVSLQVHQPCLRKVKVYFFSVYYDDTNLSILGCSVRQANYDAMIEVTQYLKAFKIYKML